MRIVTALLILAAPVAVTAQADTARPAPKHPVLNSYAAVRRQLTFAADTMPSEGYTARLAPDVRSFAEVIGHIIETNFGVCAGSKKETNPKKGQKFDGVVLAKADLVPVLKESFAYCDTEMNALNAGTMANSDLTFLATHNWQMVTLTDLYLSTRGLAPKNSEVARLRTK